MADNNVEYTEKRKRNNESVKKCRENEKQKIKEAEEKSKKLKDENKALEEKLSSMKKEVGVLKSLFDSTTKESLSTVLTMNKGADAFLSLATASSTKDDKSSEDKKPAESLKSESKTSSTRGRKRKNVD